jgi:hypothetical protein
MVRAARAHEAAAAIADAPADIQRAVGGGTHLLPTRSGRGPVS